jgi:hypothetical protein
MNMSARWVTKYGPRRVRFEPPTLEEALYAAEGLTTDTGEQISIAAELMQMPIDEARAEAERILKSRGSRPKVAGRRSLSTGAVVVERKTSRRIPREMSTRRLNAR